MSLKEEEMFVTEPVTVVSEDETVMSEETSAIIIVSNN